MGVNTIQPITTTFRQDFNIAEAWGRDAVRDTFNRCVEEWKDDIRYMTNLVLVLNHKVWDWWDKEQDSKEEPWATFYNELWRRAVDTVYDLYGKGEYSREEMDFYFLMTD